MLIRDKASSGFHLPAPLLAWYNPLSSLRCSSQQLSSMVDQTGADHWRACSRRERLLSCKSAEISKLGPVRSLRVIWCHLTSLRNCTFRHTWARVPASVRWAAWLPVSDATTTDTTPSASLLRVVCLRLALPFEAPPPVPVQPYCNSAPNLYPITFLVNFGTTCNLR